MISKQFPSELYKETNIRMNTLLVHPAFTGWRIPYEFTEDLHEDTDKEDESDFNKN